MFVGLPAWHRSDQCAPGEAAGQSSHDKTPAADEAPIWCRIADGLFALRVRSFIILLL